MVRQATEGDGARIGQLHIASWQVTYAGELPGAFLDTQDAAAWSEDWRSQIKDGVIVLLAEDGSELMGFAACGSCRGGESRQDVWEIYNLHVAPARQRQGIGSLLFEAAAQRGRGLGATELVLWVVVSNSRARRFYELKGMKCDGAKQEHPIGGGHSLQEVRYRMGLAAVRR